MDRLGTAEIQNQLHRMQAHSSFLVYSETVNPDLAWFMAEMDLDDEGNSLFETDEPRLRLCLTCFPGHMAYLKKYDPTFFATLSNASQRHVASADSRPHRLLDELMEIALNGGFMTQVNS